MRLVPFVTAVAAAQLELQQSPLGKLLRPIGDIISNAPSTGVAPSYRQDLLDLHKDLVSIKSTSGIETEVGEWLIDYFYAKGWSSTFQAVPPRDNTPPDVPRVNVIAWPDYDGIPKPKVLLTSHIDTVPPHIEYSIEKGDVTRETKILGRGTVDAKAAVAAMIVALDELVKAEEVAEDDVMLLFVVGEEVSGDGMRVFSDSLDTIDHPPHFESVIFGEPTEGKLACGHKGALFCSIKAHGKGGHSGYPWLGKSATEVLVRAMNKILEADLGSSEAYGNTTVNLGTIEGGVAANVIPEEAHAQLMVRVAIGPEKGGGKIVRERMIDILREVDEEAFEFDCSEGYGFVATECEVNGFDTIVVNYGTDVPNLAGDHKRYLYGPGTILVAHAANENITVGDLEDSVEGYKKLVLHALGK